MCDTDQACDTQRKTITYTPDKNPNPTDDYGQRLPITILYVTRNLLTTAADRHGINRKSNENKHGTDTYAVSVANLTIIDMDCCNSSPETVGAVKAFKFATEHTN